MRILAIRGENLASLAEEFEIDLVRGPLSEAGVFAIVGPTGAGKTTLLDAICVALFDRTPRLANRSPFQIGRGDNDPSALGAHDVRTLLRRGATAGWAEVDFESGDGRCYRARWSVRRARGAADGNLQDQQLTLIGIESPGTAGATGTGSAPRRSLANTERFGGTKTETLKAIQDRLGLTFDQFRRSALLAQGDFAAFLRADGKDRSELLERMTGTEIYSKLSVAAHQRAATADQWLRDCRGAATAIAVLSDDRRAVAEAELATARAASEAARRRFNHAEAHARWLAEAHVRRRALAEAEVEYQTACNAAESADSLRLELALCQRAEALRETWSQVGRLETQCASVRSELASADTAVERASAAVRQRSESRNRLAVLYEPIREARIAAHIVERAAPTPVPAETLIEAAASAAADAAHWLFERSGLAPEVARWPDLQHRLEQRTALAAALAAIDGELTTCAAQRDGLGSDRQKLLVKRDVAQQQLADAIQRAGLHADPAFQLEAAGRAEDDARQRSEKIALLEAIVSAGRRAAAEHTELRAQLAELQRSAAVDRERRAELAQERQVAIAVRDERARTVSDVRKVGGYAHARTELVDHEPCPLCGSEEHPWAGRGAVDALIEDAERGLVAAGQTLEATSAAMAELDARAVQRETERARATARCEQVEASLRAHAQTWAEQFRAAGELVLVEDPSSAEAAALVDARAAAACSALDDARRARGEAVAAAKVYAEAQGKVQICRTCLEQRDLELRELTNATTAVEAAIARLQGERAAKAERQRELERELEDAWDRWNVALPPSERSSAALPQLTSTNGRLLGGNAVGNRDFDTLSQLATAWQVRATQVSAADAMLRAALAQADAELTASERASIDAAAHRAELAKRSASLTRELADASAALDAACANTGSEDSADSGEPLTCVDPGKSLTRGETGVIDRSQLELLLRRGRNRIDELTTRLEQLERAVDRARMRIAERTRLVEDHDRQHSFTDPTIDNAAYAAGSNASGDLPELADLPAAVAAAEQGAVALASELAAAEHRAAGLAAELAVDDEARARRDAAYAAFAAAERAAEVDRVLGEVIGSHDGKLFRSFAQSLTLDSLLSVANSHLEELAPRYQLERVPKHDLELQILDRDFAGEVRSVQSLSGGECFLVSLALALGLSSMSAHDVRVRTLLIDEGFGTLDPTTLDSALAVLDELQATGRQVGIISHVPALLDRVRAHVRVAPRGGGRSKVVVPGYVASSGWQLLG